MLVSEPEIEERFGRLIVKEYIGKDKNKVPIYKCLCDCGNEKNISKYSLRGGFTKSCGCLMTEHLHFNLAGRNKKDLTGLKFDRLLVLREDINEFLLKEKKTVRWVCLCDCGKIKSIRSQCLLSRKTKSCGCYMKEVGTLVCKNRRNKNPWLVYYKRQVYQAKLKKLSLDICYYCGSIPSSIPAQPGLKEKGILFNGIDRKDNNLDYDLNNCVSCCWKCNKDKGSKTYQDFITRIEIRYKHLSLNKRI